MALNTKIYFPNPTKARVMGFSDDIRVDSHSYTPIYTTTLTETVCIRDAIFAINIGTGADPQDIYCILDISGNEIVVYARHKIAGGTTVNENITLNDLGITNIFLAPGDTITVKLTYKTGTLAATGSIKTTLFIEDYTA